MRKICNSLVVLLIVISCFTTCGPTQKDLEEAERKADSLMQSERDAAIEKADSILNASLTKEDSGVTVQQEKQVEVQ